MLKKIKKVSKELNKASNIVKEPVAFDPATVSISDPAANTIASLVPFA